MVLMDVLTTLEQTIFRQGPYTASITSKPKAHNLSQNEKGKKNIFLIYRLKHMF